MIKWKGFSYTPVIWGDKGWYFYDEAWMWPWGPYHSYTEAAAQLLDYCEWLKEKEEDED